MWTIVVLLSVAGSVLCRPPIATSFGNFSTEPLSLENLEWLQRHTPSHRSFPPGFQFMYVNQQGHIVENNRPSSGRYIQVVGSPRVPHSALYVAAQEVGKMLQHSPSFIFNNIATHSGAGVGIFTAQEKITIFPEMSRYRNTPACKGRCDGSCAHTCTFDGRKYENIAGVTSSRSLVLMENVMCMAHDPYHHHDNILVHEFGHTVQRVGMPSSLKSQVTRAYNHAKQNHLWTPSSYAMSNNAEYFAEGTGAYFLVNLQSTTGGMTHCPGHRCRTVAEVRNYLHQHDPQLWTVLTNVYTNGNATLESDLHICPSN